MLLAQAIRSAKSSEPAAIRDALEKIRGSMARRRVQLLAGGPRRLTEQAFVMVRVAKGDWEIVR